MLALVVDTLGSPLRMAQIFLESTRKKLARDFHETCGAKHSQSNPYSDHPIWISRFRARVQENSDERTPVPRSAEDRSFARSF